MRIKLTFEEFEKGIDRAIGLNLDQDEVMTIHFFITLNFFAKDRGSLPTPRCG